jgi:hypothetical protein
MSALQLGLPGSPMGNLQTFFFIFVEGLTGLAIVLILAILAARQLWRMWRTGEHRLVFYIALSSVLVFIAFTAITTYGVTWGAFHYSGP